MPRELSAYRDVAPPGQVDLLYRLSNQARGKHLLHVSSTKMGGGIAEGLQNLTPLLREMGIHTRWEVMEGTEAFYQTTQCFHNGLQGQDVKLTDAIQDAYVEGTRARAHHLDLSADVVMTYDPAPLALIDEAPADSRWIWRCHLDVSRPQRKVWGFLRSYVAKYDAVVFSLPQFAQPLSLPQFLMTPSIDPLSDKNREMEQEEMTRILDKLGVPRDKPILLQVSR
ncbi:MAG: glycosyl transferase family 1, partial [Nitrospirales bacterium]